mmetsp:Transcript_4167/g.5463  ORF Transcript_4167/g.5463 Transcript_4167/m.5463 type:complete len:349 (-) Transcript_4167:134-1180(-)|eukprot:CAMPEP_0198145068 /NCGR_PEP_ID=MMETSP1443-20131203/20845_1 /TAXON_ID=186043 /ORGANISM="Entomoneis sp., Strain CCMP2396" /LENGTH=348 /DNA_ID=CAMNT_0043808591 /DNA_START=19 /DNA_END=1065 /DNA_ORIENTATION=+
MGNGTSSSESNRLQLVVDPPGGRRYAYLAGSKISGTVNVTTAGKNTNSGLTVSLIGKEDVKVRYKQTHSNGNNASTTKTHYAYAKCDIVRVEIPLAGAEAVVEPGNHSFPFEVQLPVNIPSSMTHCGDGGYCNIVYKIKVSVKGKWRGDKVEKHIRVLARPPFSAPVPSFFEPETQQITSCYCFPRGAITFAASIDDTRVGKGDAVNVDFGCKNEASTRIEYVEANIKENIYWKARGHNSCSKHTIVERQFNQTDNMEKRSKQQMRQLKEDLGSGIISRGLKVNLYRELLKVVKDGRNRVTLDIPLTVKPTYRGSCITVSHTLTIKVKTPSGSTNPKRKIPIQIVTAK